MTTAAEARRAETGWERYAPLAGVAAVVLWVIGLAVWMSSVENGSPADILDSYREKEGRILLGGFLFLLGTFLFFWFLAALRSRLRFGELEPHRITSVAYAGGVAFGVFALAYPGPDMAAAIADGKDLSRPAAMALHTISDAFFIGGEMSAAVLLAAVGLLALRGVLPRWLGWISLLVALVLIVLPVGWAALIFGFPIWVLLTSWLCWRSVGARSGEAAA